MANLQFNKLIEDKIFLLQKNYTEAKILFSNKSEDYFHPGEYGTYRERLIIEFIKNLIPGNFGVSSGFIINNKDKLSTQCDLIVYDKINAPLLHEGLTNFYPIETCVAVGEVKSKLNAKDLKNALFKLAKHKELRNLERDFKVIKREVSECPPDLMKILRNIMNDSDKEIVNDNYKEKHESFLEFLNWLLEKKCLSYPEYKKQQIKDLIKRVEEKWENYNVHLHNLDNVMTFLVCEKLDLNEEALKNLPRKISEWYEEGSIDPAYRHNIILSLEDGVILYHDFDEKQVLAQPIKYGVRLENVLVRSYNPLPLLLETITKGIEKIRKNVAKKSPTSIDQIQQQLLTNLTNDINNLHYIKELQLTPKFDSLANKILNAFIEEMINSPKLDIDSEVQDLTAHYYKWMESYILSIDNRLLSKSTEHIKIFSHYIWLNTVDTTVIHPEMAYYLDPINYKNLNIQKES